MLVLGDSHLPAGIWATVSSCFQEAQRQGKTGSTMSVKHSKLDIGFL